MINKMIDATPGNEIPKLLDEADQLFKDQKFEESLSAFEKLVGMDPGNKKLLQVLLKMFNSIKTFDDAIEMFESFDEKITKNEEIIKNKKNFLITLTLEDEYLKN